MLSVTVKIVDRVQQFSLAEPAPLYTSLVCVAETAGPC